MPSQRGKDFTKYFTRGFTKLDLDGGVVFVLGDLESLELQDSIPGTE